MSMSGIKVPDNFQEIFNDMKIRKTNQYVIVKINNAKTTWEIVGKGDPVDTSRDLAGMEQFYNDLTDQYMTDDQPVYALIDFTFKREGLSSIAKMAGISWAPDTSTVGKKMIHASSKDTLEKSFPGLGIKIQCSDRDDLSFEEVVRVVIKSAV